MLRPIYLHLMELKQIIIQEGYRVRVAVAGNPQNPPVMLVHGLPSFHGVWRTTIEALADRYYCIAPDLPGFGGSEKDPAAGYTIHDHARRVLEIADAFGLDRFTVMGHSMGGQIALVLAGKLAPARIERVVMIDGVVSGRLAPLAQFMFVPSMAIGALWPFLHIIARLLMGVPLLRRLAAWGWYDDLKCLPDALWLEECQMGMQAAVARPAYQSARALQVTSTLAYLPRITAPTLVIFGENDRLVPVSEAAYCEQLIPDCRVLRLAHCGHVPMVEQEAAYFEAVTGFLAG